MLAGRAMAATPKLSHCTPNQELVQGSPESHRVLSSHCVCVCDGCVWDVCVRDVCVCGMCVR